MDDRGLDIRPRLLAQFLAIVDHGDVRLAAQALDTSPRMLSRTLRELEHESGEPLLLRGTRTLTLTATGVRLERSARRVLAAVGRLQALAAEDRATLRVAHVATTDTLAVVLEHALASGLDLTLLESVAPGGQELRALVDHRLDVALLAADDELPPGVAAEPLRVDPLLLVGPGEGKPAMPCAAAFGPSWPAHDALIDRYEAAAGAPVRRVPVPVGSGRELAAALRQALGAGVLAPASLAGAGHSPASDLCLTWRIAWRTDDVAPAVHDFVAAALRAARANAWLP